MLLGVDRVCTGEGATTDEPGFPVAWSHRVLWFRCTQGNESVIHHGLCCLDPSFIAVWQTQWEDGLLVKMPGNFRPHPAFRRLLQATESWAGLGNETMASLYFGGQCMECLYGVTLLASKPDFICALEK